MLTIKYLGVALIVLISAGCSTVKPNDTIAQWDDNRYDMAYVAAVNRVATARGVTVIWREYPMKATAPN